jgi:hypothetical protein
MTHITEARVIGSHAGMGGSTTVATRYSLTVTDILRAGRRRRVGRREMIAPRSTWDSEGGGIGNEVPRPQARVGLTPRGLGS